MNRVGALATLRSLDSELAKITSIKYKKQPKRMSKQMYQHFKLMSTKEVEEVAAYCKTLKEFGVTEAEIVIIIVWDRLYMSILKKHEFYQSQRRSQRKVSQHELQYCFNRKTCISN